jgi:hypothetical protein
MKQFNLRIDLPEDLTPSDLALLLYRTAFRIVRRGYLAPMEDAVFDFQGKEIVGQWQITPKEENRDA